jgi:hypothetical protein
MKSIPNGNKREEYHPYPQKRFKFAGLRYVPESGMLTLLYEQKCEQARYYFYF